eukprot:m.85923 g.85923  ORF g.85923 m.85923 type:complete len:403 (-) comp25910_c0_seq1:42-1250(-)
MGVFVGGWVALGVTCLCLMALVYLHTNSDAPEVAAEVDIDIDHHADSHAALAFSLLGGGLMGMYPVFIKTDAVHRANVHPIIFQLYKSTVVFCVGWLFLLPRLISRKPTDDAPLFVFSPWALISAAAWIPSGIGTILAVPKLGMGMSIALNSATGSVLSFVFFVMLFDTPIKRYSCGEDCSYARAPLYLAATIIGTLGMVFPHAIATKLGVASSEIVTNTRHSAPVAFTHRWWQGVSAATVAGAFMAVQYAAVTIGKQQERKLANCEGSMSDCPPWLVEEFNNLGSWMVSFGIGAMLFTLSTLAAVVYVDKKLPDLHWSTMKKAGVCGGLCWVGGNVFITAAVVVGGNAVAVAQAQSATILFSNLYGMIIFGELAGVTTKVFWSVAAAWTLIFMSLLGFEKG